MININKRKYRNYLIFIIGLCISLGSYLLYTGSGIRFNESEKQWIEAHGDEYIFVGMPETPLEIIYCELLCEKLSQETGLKIIPFDDYWQNIVELFNKGNIHMSTGIAIEESWHSNFTVVSNLKPIDFGLYSKPTHRLNSLNDADNQIIGFIKSSNTEELLKSKYPERRFKGKVYNSYYQLVEALDKGEIVGFFSNKNPTLAMDSYYFEAIKPLSVNNNHMAVSNKYSDLITIMEKTFRQLNRSDWNKEIDELIQQKYEAEYLSFTIDEIAYIQTKGEVKIGIQNNLAPMYWDHNGKAKGILPAVLKHLSYITDLKFDFVNIEDSTTYDLIFDDSTGVTHYDSYIPVFYDNQILIGVKGSDYISSLEELEGYRVGMLTNVKRQALLKGKVAGMIVVNYDNYHDLYGDLDGGSIDYILESEYIYPKLNSLYDFTAYKGEILTNDSYLHLADGLDEDALLVSIINKGMSSMDLHQVADEGIGELINDGDGRIDIFLAIGAIVLVLSYIIIKKITTVQRAAYNKRNRNEDNGLYNMGWLKDQLNQKNLSETYIIAYFPALKKIRNLYGESIYKETFGHIVNGLKEHIGEYDCIVYYEFDKVIINYSESDDEKIEMFMNHGQTFFGLTVAINNMNYSIVANIGCVKRRFAGKLLGYKLLCEYLDLSIYYSMIRGMGIRFTNDLLQNYLRENQFNLNLIDAVINERLQLNYQKVKTSSTYPKVDYNIAVNCHLDTYGDLNFKSFSTAVSNLNIETQVDKIAIQKLISVLENLEKEKTKICVTLDISEKTLLDKSFKRWFEEKVINLKMSQIICLVKKTFYDEYMEELYMLKSNRLGFGIKDFGSSLTDVMIFDDDLIEFLVIDYDLIDNLAESEIHEETLKFVIRLAEKQNKGVFVKDLKTQIQMDIIANKNVGYLSGHIINPYKQGVV